MASEQSVLDRRSFIKAMLAAGATVTVASCAPSPSPATPGLPVAVTVPAWIHPKSLVRSMPGYGGARLTWKPGDTAKWLPPAKYPNDAAADLLAGLSKDRLATIYERMVMARIWENTMRDIWLKGADDLYGFYHCRVGQEAIPTAACACLNKDDLITSTHSGHTDLFAKGGDPAPMAAEIFWRKTGYCKGYGGSMHMTNAALGILGMNGVVGGGFCIGPGAAWAAKVKRAGQVVLTFAGDGATNSQYYFSALRSCANYKLPWIHVIENNFYAISNPIAVVCPSPYMADYGIGLGMPAVVVDGTNVAHVYAAVKDAVERARAGEGPSVVECLAFRWYDHVGWAGAKMGEDAAWGLPYRTDGEVRAWLSLDPIPRYGAFLVDRGLFTQGELEAIKTNTKAQVDASIEFARASPPCRPEDGVKQVWDGSDAVPATQFFEHTVIL